AVPARPARAPGLLPQGHPRARPPGDDDGVEARDVDAELERVRRREREEVALAQRPLERAALLREVPAAVGRDPRAEPGPRKLVLDLLGDDLRAVAGADE